MIPWSTGKVWWQFKNWKLGGISFFIKCTIFTELGLKGTKMITTTKWVDWTQLVFLIARVFYQRVIYTALSQYVLKERYGKQKQRIHIYKIHMDMFLSSCLFPLISDKISEKVDHSPKKFLTRTQTFFSLSHESSCRESWVVELSQFGCYEITALSKDNHIEINLISLNVLSSPE